MRDGDRYRISRRVRDTHPPIMQTMKSMPRGRDTADLSQGIPFFGPPRGILREAMEEAESTGRYGPDAGDTDLRSAISDRVRNRYGYRPDPEKEVMVTPGANMAFFEVAAAICDPGDEIVLFSPYYFNHRMSLDILGLRTRMVPTDENFHPKVEELREIINERTRAVVLVTPNNPTGAVYPRSTIREIAEICKDSGIYLITDETYEDFVYRGNHFSGCELMGDLPGVISLFSLSKAYGISGWRIGYSVFPEHLFDNMLKVQDTTVICPTRISQRLAYRLLVAHPGPLVDDIDYLEKSSQMVNDWLGNHRGILGSPRTEGAFYSFPAVLKDIGKDSLSIVKKILSECGVIVVPGSPFGAEGPPRFRISFGNVKHDKLKESLERLDGWLEDLNRR